jgi:stage III sporulation protein AC
MRGNVRGKSENMHNKRKNLSRYAAAEWRLIMGTGVDIIFKIAAIGIITAVLYQLLKNSQREELALMTSIAGLVVVLLMLMQEISLLFSTIKTLFGL